MSSLEIGLLGPVVVQREGQPVALSNRKAVAVLAYLP
jgi:DNA-binding SARP family transcriptional activator